jgi:hypothetical protein
MEQQRYLELPIRSDLESKMVFLAGPRQVGKTVLARRILAESEAGVYLNWDNRGDRKEIRAARWPGGNALVVLDELHKWRSWKGWIKGEFDKHRERLRFLVTGSARMDTYRRGGDSLQGRYQHFRLHPFSLAELESSHASDPPTPGTELTIPNRASQDLLASLVKFGGFPEPFLRQSERTLRRWQKDRLDRFFREDVRDLERVHDLATLQILADLLPERVGSPLSLNALREDLEVSHRAVSGWVEILERLYHVFRLPPYVSTKVRGLRKMPKLYFWDWSLVIDPGPRFENLIASHLLKLTHFLQDRDGHTVELRYLRDRTGREVDFLILVGRKPWMAVEAKISATQIDPALFYFRDRLKIPWVYQVVQEGERDFVQDGIRCLPADRFLAALV